MCVCIRVLLPTELPSCPLKIKKMDRSLSYSPTFTLNPTWSTCRLQTRRLALREGEGPHPSPHEWRQHLVLERTGGAGLGMSVSGALLLHRSPERDRPSLRSHSMRAAVSSVLARDSLRAEFSSPWGGWSWGALRD